MLQQIQHQVMFALKAPSLPVLTKEQAIKVLTCQQRLMIEMIPERCSADVGLPPGPEGMMEKKLRTLVVIAKGEDLLYKETGFPILAMAKTFNETKLKEEPEFQAMHKAHVTELTIKTKEYQMKRAQAEG